MDFRAFGIAFTRGWAEDRTHVWEDEGGDAPELEFGGDAFALTWGFMDDPAAFISMIRCGGAGDGC